MGRPVRGRCTISMADSDRHRDGNASAFAPIVVLSDNAYGEEIARLRLQG